MAAAKGKASQRSPVRASAVRDAASDALLSALMPLTTLALEVGLSIERVYQILRLAAVNQLILKESSGIKGPSISAISAITGIPRSEVSKLIKHPVSLVKQNRVNEQITNSILLAWREDVRFTAANGQPASLSMYGRGRSFERLAKLYGRGIPARALLEELKRTKNITVGQDQVVHQNFGVTINRGLTTAGIRALGDHVSELVASMCHNMNSPDSARLVARVANKRISLEELPLLRREIANLAERYLGEMQELFSRNSKSARRSGDEIALSVTTYCFEKPSSKSAQRKLIRKNYRRKI